MCFSPCKNEQKKIAATNNDDEKNFFFYKKKCVFVCLFVWFFPLLYVWKKQLWSFWLMRILEILKNPIVLPLMWFAYLCNLNILRKKN